MTDILFILCFLHTTLLTLKNTNKPFKHYLHEQFVFWGFVCDMHIFMCWLSVIKFPVFMCIPLLIYQRWNRYSFSQNRWSAVSNSWLNTFSSLKRINRHLIKWNIQAMPLSHDADSPQWKKHQLQMAIHADFNPGRFHALRDGTEFSSGLKNGSY